MLALPMLNTPTLLPTSDSGVAGDNKTDITSPLIRVAFASNVVAGDIVELYLADAPMAQRLVQTVSAQDVINGFVTLPVVAGDLGADGVKQISAHISDATGQLTSTSAVLSVTLDTTAPTATIARVGNATQVAGSPLQFAVTFSEAATGVDASAFSLSGTNAGATITGVTQVDASHYTVNVAPGAGTGTVELDLTGAKIADLAGNGFGGGVFQPTTTLPVGSSPFGPDTYSVTLADVNGDGKLDIVASNASSSTVSVLLGNGDGTFQPQTTLATGTSPTSTAVADLNGDGKLDLVTVNTDTKTLSVRLGNGDGTFRRRPRLQPATRGAIPSTGPCIRRT